MNYRYRKGAASATRKDRGFSFIVIVSVLMIAIAGYLAITWDSGDNTTDPGNVSLENEPGYEGENPSWENEGDVNVTDPNGETEVNKPEEGVTENPTEGETPDPAVKYMWPCAGTIIKEYSGLTPVFNETLKDWRVHTGVDFQTIEPEDVIASADGVVEDVYTDGLMGVTVLIKHADNVYTLYQSLSEDTAVAKKMEVKQGDVIGKTGKTASCEEAEGNHVHFAIIKDGQNCDPSEYIAAE